ncbi:MAG: virulence RhuM family protein [Arcobacteraceae bacterium]|nr:virulence RhuM family protein [Arcobacteraceae bacterium]
MSNIVFYNDGELELDISVSDETIWLNQKQLAELFDVTKQNISLHINKIFQDKELSKDSTVKFFLIVQQEGKRKVKRDVEHYNLDVIISVGYRVNSLKATRFRQWATKVLKSYVENGYVINSDKITNERFVSLENDVQILKNQFKNISTKLEDKSIKVKQGILYNGEIFDAYVFVLELIKSAKNEIVLVDNYIDETVLTLLSENHNIKVSIYTKEITKKLKLDVEKYNKQYNNLEIKTNKNFHDRFLVLDKKELYHIGASLKDLGNKVFAFSKIQTDMKLFLQQLQND